MSYTGRRVLVVIDHTPCDCTTLENETQSHHRWALSTYAALCFSLGPVRTVGLFRYGGWWWWWGEQRPFPRSFFRKTTTPWQSEASRLPLRHVPCRH